MLLQFSQFFPVCPPLPSIPYSLWQSNPLKFMSMGHACKFFSYSTSYSVLNIPPAYSVRINLCFLISAPFPPSTPSPLPTGNHPNDLHIYDSVSVLLVCLVCFLDSIVDSCKFIAILMPIFFIIFLR